MPHTNNFVHTPGSDYVCSCTVIECIHTLRYRHTANLPEIVTEMVKCQNITMSRTEDCFTDPCLINALHWRHNDHDGVSNHQPHGYILSRLFRHRSKKTSKLRVTGLRAGNSPGTGEFPAQMASNAVNVSIWWRHHVGTIFFLGTLSSLSCHCNSFEYRVRVDGICGYLIYRGVGRQGDMSYFGSVWHHAWQMIWRRWSCDVKKKTTWTYIWRKFSTTYSEKSGKSWSKHNVTNAHKTIWQRIHMNGFISNLSNTLLFGYYDSFGWLARWTSLNMLNICKFASLNLNWPWKQGLFILSTLSSLVMTNDDKVVIMTVPVFSRWGLPIIRDPLDLLQN